MTMNQRRVCLRGQVMIPSMGRPPKADLLSSKLSSQPMYCALEIMTSRSRQPRGVGYSMVPSRTVIAEIQQVPALREQNGRGTQPLLVTVRNLGSPMEGTIRAPDVVQPVSLQHGDQTIEINVPAVSTAAE